MTTRTRLLALLLAAIAALSACGGIPDGVGVHRVEAQGDADENPVSYQPAGPRDNATPDQIVRGYLDAMLAYPVSSGTAEKFLHRSGEAWDATAGVSVYQSARVEAIEQVPVGDDTGLQVEVALQEEARLDRQGHFEASVRRRTIRFVLLRDGGQWRIDQAPAGTFVTRKFFTDYYRAFDLYYFDPSGSRVVADPVHLPLGEQVATALVTNLLAGPGPEDGGTLRTYVPSAVRLRGSVPVAADGLADVVLDGLGDLPESTRDHVSAQLVWTLRQVPEVTTLRVRPPGPAVRTDAADLEPVGGWGVYGPTRTWSGPFGLRAGQVVRLDDGAVEPVQQRVVDAATVERLAVAPGGDSIAAVTDGRSSLVFGDVSGEDRRRVPGSGLLAPVWDAEGRVWAVDERAGRTRVRVLGRQDAVPDLGAWPDLRPVAFALSPDLARYALVARQDGRTRVLVGRVLSDGQGRISGLSVPTALPQSGPSVTSPYADPRSVSFAGTGHVVMIALTTTGEPQVFAARVDGSSVTGGRSSDGPLLVDVDARELVADPVTGRLHVRDADGTLWQSDGAAAWTRSGAEGVLTLSPNG